MIKKTLLVILVIVLAVSVVSCGGKNNTEVIGVVLEVNESGGFLIDILEGYAEDKMQVHLDKRIKYEEGVEQSDITPGVVVGIYIKDEVMESYPVQATATRILWTENIVTGKILSVGEEAALINVTDGIDVDMMQLWFEEETVFHRDIPRIMEKQKTITFTMKDEVLESEPIQGFAIRIISYE
jgi:hypothetical protein